MKIIQQQNTFCYAKFSAEMKKKKKKKKALISILWYL